jgi:hypothetical protein
VGDQMDLKVFQRTPMMLILTFSFPLELLSSPMLSANEALHVGYESPLRGVLISQHLGLSLSLYALFRSKQHPLVCKLQSVRSKLLPVCIDLGQTCVDVLLLLTDFQLHLFNTLTLFCQFW